MVASPPTSLALATACVGSGITGRYTRRAEAVPATMFDARIEIAEAIKITPAHALALSINGVRLGLKDLNDLVEHRIDAGGTEVVEVVVESSDITILIRHVSCALKAGELQVGEPRLFSMTVPTEQPHPQFEGRGSSQTAVAVTGGLTRGLLAVVRGD